MRVDMVSLKHLFFGLQHGETLARILMNSAVETVTLHGKILDIGAGSERSSYFDHFRLKPRYSIITLDIDAGRNPSVVADIERRFPLPDQSFDGVVCMNLLEHVWRFGHVSSEAYRVLRRDGVFVGATPFLFPIHPFPKSPGANYHDFFRFTEESLHRMLTEAGFHKVTIQPLGFGPVTTALFFAEFPFITILKFIPFLRFLLYLVAIGFDMGVYFPLLRMRRISGTPFVLLHVFQGRK